MPANQQARMLDEVSARYDYHADRLDTELPKRAFLGWLRGESNHCSMAAIPTLNLHLGEMP